MTYLIFRSDYNRLATYYGKRKGEGENITRSSTRNRNTVKAWKTIQEMNNPLPVLGDPLCPLFNLLHPV